MYPTALFNFPSSNLSYHNVTRAKPHAVIAPQHTLPALNDSSTSQDGDYKLKPNEILQSSSAVYEVLDFIGRGTFGQVVKCCRKDTRELVAVKILKNHPNYARQGDVEIQILTHLSSESSDKHNFVKALECFKHQNHTCLVFELLERNLFDYLKMNDFAPLPLNHIRPILQQVTTALIKLAELRVIHADIKPENIMLVNPGFEPFRVKLIDFGSATYTTRTQDNTYLQSRYYRAPEVILGVPFSEKIDVWSLGCVIAELFLGCPIYPGGCEFDQIRYITSTEGLPPLEMLERGKKSRQYYIPPNSFSLSWQLKTEEQYLLETGTRSKESRKYKFKRLSDLMLFSVSDAFTEQDTHVEDVDRYKFVELLTMMLSLDPSQRCSPLDCKLHEYVTMNHLTAYQHRKPVRQGIEVMRRACQRDPIKSRDSSQIIFMAQQQQQQQQQQQHQQQQQLKYFQALSISRQREQLQQLQAVQQHELTRSLHNIPTTSLQYYTPDSLHTLTDRQNGIYPTPDWSPGSADWQQSEYGTKSHPIVVPDSPSRPLTNDQLIQEQLYKAQLLRNALSQTSHRTAPPLDLSTHFLAPGNTLALTGLNNVLTNRGYI